MEVDESDRWFLRHNQQEWFVKDRYEVTRRKLEAWRSRLAEKWGVLAPNYKSYGTAALSGSRVSWMSSAGWGSGHGQGSAA